MKRINILGITIIKTSHIEWMENTIAHLAAQNIRLKKQKSAQPRKTMRKHNTKM